MNRLTRPILRAASLLALGSLVGILSVCQNTPRGRMSLPEN